MYKKMQIHHGNYEGKRDRLNFRRCRLSNFCQINITYGLGTMLAKAKEIKDQPRQEAPRRYGYYMVEKAMP